ncbi:MAG: EF-hand domain-containing protein [Halocynthiibacter sp.]
MFKKLTAATFVLALTLPAAGFAADKMDVDSDGVVSADEFSAAHPEAPEGTFEKVDQDADGTLSAEEITAAQEVGLLPNAS